MNPVFLDLGFFQIYWYGLAYVAGILTCWALAKRLFETHDPQITSKIIDDFVPFIVLGVVAGGRLGHAIFYDPHLFLNPLELMAIWTGGMSFHGGILGCAAALYGYGRRHNIHFFQMSDIFTITAPLGLFFGRIANFVNGELYGRPTHANWGVIFQNDGVLRHPSQLYEAFLEGLVLFCILFVVRRRVLPHRGVMSALFLGIYGVFRFISEYFRAPVDGTIDFFGTNITMGQFYTLPLIILSIYWIYIYFPTFQNALKSARDHIQSRPLFYAASFGCCAGVAFAPLQSFWLLMMGFVGFLTLFQRIAPKLNLRETLKFGFFFSYGFFLSSLYWVGLSFREAGLLWAAPFMVLIFPLAPALVQTCLFYGLYYIKNMPFLTIAFAIGWSALEIFKGSVFDFSWSFIGYALPDTLQQLGAYVGVAWLSFGILCIFALMQKRIFWVGLCLFYAGSYFGANRLKTPQLPLYDTYVRLIQPSIPQKLKYDRDHIERNYLLHLSLSQMRAEKPLNLIVWPEAAIPFPLNEFQNMQMSLMEAVPENGHIFVGALRSAAIQNAGKKNIYNSVFLLNSKAQIVDFYDKTYLTPFGEYIPLRKFLPFEKLTHGGHDFTPGCGLKTLSHARIPEFLPLICYEVLFQNAIQSQKDFKWMLVVTNDAWFGATSGPYQHLQIARMRSIETGVSTLRCGNNGVTAVIDGYGRILQSIPLNHIGFLDTQIPKPIF